MAHYREVLPTILTLAAHPRQGYGAELMHEIHKHNRAGEMSAMLVLRLRGQGRHFCSGFNIGRMDGEGGGAHLGASGGPGRRGLPGGAGMTRLRVGVNLGNGADWGIGLAWRR